MQTEIQTGKGIEGLVSASQVEEERHIEASEHDLSQLHKRYVQLLDVPMWNHYCFYVPLEFILTPDQINTFLQQTIPYENHPKYPDNTGRFITQLIQNSYIAGMNDFTLNTTALKELHRAVYRIKGPQTKPLKLTIIGNAGALFGFESINLLVNITGNSGSALGGHSSESTFNIQGLAGRGCGEMAFHSTFKTPNETSLQQMLKSVPDSNRVIFIHPDGTEEIKRDY